MNNQVEQRLRRYELLIAHSRDIILFVRRGDGHILEANAAATKAYGYNREELLTLTIHDLRAAETKALTADQLAKAEAQGILFETIHRHKDGTTFPVEVSSQGTIIDGKRALISIIRDITDRKRAEEKLRESEGKYRSVVENSMDAILITRPEGRTLSANPEACRMFGMTEEEMITAGRAGIIDPNDPRHQAAWKERAQTGRVRAEVTFVRKDGSKFPADLSSSVFADNQGDVKTAMCIRDITERKQAERVLRESEEQFRQLADAMPQLVWTATPDGKLDYFNYRLREFKRLKQMTPSIHPEDWPRTVETWQRGIKSGRDYEIEHRLQRADGSFKWFLSRAVPIRDERGCMIKWFGTSTDVDDHKQAEQALQRSRDELEEKVRERTTELRSLMEDLEKSRDDLRKLASELVLTGERERKRLAVTLHDEVAQTLAAIRMRLDQLQSIPVDHEYRQAIEQARELLSHSIQQTRALMKDISNPVLYDLGLRSAVEDLAGQIKDRHGIQVKCSFEGQLTSLGQDLNVMVFQVVKELLQNVIKHSGARGANVRIIEDKDSIQMIVADDGVGFDINENDSSDYIEGGFGLFSIRERVKSFNGNIEIKSKPGIGSRVSVLLPKTTTSKSTSGKTPNRKDHH